MYFMVSDELRGNKNAIKFNSLINFLLVCFFSISLMGCDYIKHHEKHEDIQGYVEGEFVYLKPLNAGVVKRLNANKGERVSAGSPLILIETEPDQRYPQTDNHVNMEQSQLTNITRQKSELKRLHLQSEGDKKVYSIAERNKDQTHTISLFTPGGSQAERGQREVTVGRLKSHIRTGGHPFRHQGLPAQQSRTEAVQSSMRKDSWNLPQQTLYARGDSQVYDVYYRPGEWVPSGRPVLSLLPDKNIKVRFFINTWQLNKIKVSDTIKMSVDQGAVTFEAKIIYISFATDNTASDISSKDDKRAFLVEARPEGISPRILHPGMPVKLSI